MEAPANGAIPAIAPASLTVADLDLYEKATKARLDFMARLKRDIDAAKTSQDSMQDMSRMSSLQPDSEAARAAGVTVVHEQGIIRTVTEMISTLHAQAITGLEGQTDTVHMDSAARAQLRPILAQDQRSRDSTTKAVMGSMTPGVAAAFQERRANLDSLTFQAMYVLAGTKKS